MSEGLENAGGTSGAQIQPDEPAGRVALFASIRLEAQDKRPAIDDAEIVALVGKSHTAIRWFSRNSAHRLKAKAVRIRTVIDGLEAALAGLDEWSSHLPALDAALNDARRNLETLERLSVAADLGQVSTARIDQRVQQLVAILVETWALHVDPAIGLPRSERPESPLLRYVDACLSFVLFGERPSKKEILNFIRKHLQNDARRAENRRDDAPFTEVDLSLLI